MYTHTSGGSKFCAVGSHGSRPDEKNNAHSPMINKAPNYPVRIIPGAKLNGTASGYLPDPVLNIILGGIGGSNP